MPELNGATGWLNTPPLTRAALRGKVVLVDFWTYSCINCLRALPYIRAWAEKYKDHGLVVLGVHAPEFAFEKDPANVKKAVESLGVTYPVALDSNLAIWQAFNNQYWPAHYFIDAEGRIRAHHFGEGEYDRSERIIQTLLEEKPATRMCPAASSIRMPTVRWPPPTKTTCSRRKPIWGMAADMNFASNTPQPDKAADLQDALSARPQSVGPDRALDHRRGKIRERVRRARRLPSTSMPATCIWCWVRPWATSRCASK